MHPPLFQYDEIYGGKLAENTLLKTWNSILSFMHISQGWGCSIVF